MTDLTTEDALRAEVRAWLDENWDPDLPLLQWRTLLAESGFAFPTWPVGLCGRGLSPEMGAVVSEVLNEVGVVGPAIGVGMSLAAPTILEHGSEELKRRLLPPMVIGEHTWCQLFSEPGNGSDLAGLTTHAVRDGDEWIVNGQKVWTTGAHHATYGMLLARTDWDVPKHQGITFFAFPMNQPGIEVRPLRQMNERSSFNEVFITDAHVPHANIVGELNGGWKVALTTLAHERGLAAALMGAIPKITAGKTAMEALEEAMSYLKTYEWYPQRAGRADMAPGQAKARGVNTDPIMRQHLAKLHTLEQTSKWNAQRARDGRRLGRPPGPEGSLSKLAASEIARTASDVHAKIAGAHAMLSGPSSPANGIIAEVLVSTPAASIAGGTDNIQKNIVAERVLGLPKEPSDDATLAFREVRTNAGRR
ncbi:MAG: acyl-CoA dehydrogenase family protein [Actinobacteria bacterium]|nr:acyl-CoA dehydrogenase family protein [Actinomycetota bacterium]MBI3256488.1 acyl-CoA dehydrogenase family protein [Actinomycetota bacterium]